MMWFIGILIVLLLLYGLILFLSFASALARWFPLPPEKQISKKVWKSLQPRMEQLRSLPQEKLEIRSEDGLRLIGHYIPAENAKRTLILVHGWRSRWYIDFANTGLWFHGEQCNLLLVEQRAQGESEGKYMTFGVKERMDCRKWVDRCLEKAPDLPVYLYGTSMGAATVLMMCGMDLPKQVKGVIADSGFTSPYAIIRQVGKQNFHSPLHPTMDAMVWFGKLLARVDIREYSALEAMKQCRIPVMLIHGKADRFVPCRMSQENYDACTGDKQLYLFEDAGHCSSYWKHTAEYQTVMKDFFRLHP